MADGGPPNPEKEDKPEERKVEEQNLIVALRIRPINEDEIGDGATPIAHRVDDNMVVLLDPTEDPDDILRANRSREKQYVFDKSLDGSATQKEVYENTTRFLIPSVINGYNATVFAYGATGAGKTYTMLGTDDEPGIMVHTLNDLFLEMDRAKTENIYKVTLSYLEIYNEMIRDLLNPSTGYLDMREDAKGVQVAGLSQTMARSPGEVMAILKRGNLERTQEPTAANKTSSRSHAVLQITVRQRTRVRDIKSSLRIGKLFLIDLAGSERAANTHNRGKRMVEGAHINRSLLALGNCINALSDKNGSKYVNYRDSKLTRLLKDALGGNCKTVMIAHISPASVHFEESRNTLVYADRAKNIKTKVRRNVMDVSYHIAQYTNIIQELKEEIKRLRSKIAGRDSALVSRNSSAIHAIQNEVLEVARKEDQLELSKLKEELLRGFREQMECRRTLMEINHNAMEISLEAARNQNIIDKWERNSKPYQGEDEEENKYREEEKDSEEEPGEVKNAKDEIKVLERERDNNEKMKSRLLKELDNAKNKASKVEEMLPNRINSLEQQEVLSLLCKVHELEIENMQMQSSCVLRDFELRRREVQLERYRVHRSLCDEIIQQQRQLIQEHKVECSQDLENLLLLYHQQVKDRATSPAERHLSLPDINLYKSGSVTNIGLVNSRRMLDADPISDSERLSAVDEETSGSDPLPKLFTQASTANVHTRKQILQKSPLNIGKVDDPSSGSPFPRQKSIITLSSRSNSSSPSLQAAPDGTKIHLPVESPVKEENRSLILNNTRSIAMLAQQRRSKAQVDAFNTERSTMHGDHDTNALSVSGGGNPARPSDVPGYKLTQSRLAQHDNHFGSQATLRHLVSDDVLSNPGTDNHSVVTAENNFKKNRSLYRNAAPKKTQNGKKKNKQGEFAAYQQLAKQSPRKSYHSSEAYASNTNLIERNRRARLPVAHKNNRAKVPVHHTDVDFDDDLKDLDSFTPPPYQSVRGPPEKAKLHNKNRKMKAPVSSTEPLTTSTPQTKKTKKISPTIPNYGKGDISVSGFGLQK